MVNVRKDTYLSNVSKRPRQKRCVRRTLRMSSACLCRPASLSGVTIGMVFAVQVILVLGSMAPALDWEMVTR